MATIDEILAMSEDTGWIPAPQNSMLIYDGLSDTNVVYIRDGKADDSISKQAVYQYSANACVIRFVRDRYADGVDLSTGTVNIHYTLPDGAIHDEGLAINVCYNESLIRYDWVLSQIDTKAVGDIVFSAYIHGTHSITHKSTVELEWQVTDAPSNLAILPSHVPEKYAIKGNDDIVSAIVESYM